MSYTGRVGIRAGLSCASECQRGGIHIIFGHRLFLRRALPLPPPLQLPRAKAIVSAPDVLSPSGPDEAEEFCRAVLGVELSSGLLESWVENLREWLARQVGGGRGGAVGRGGRWGRGAGRAAVCGERVENLREWLARQVGGGKGGLVRPVC